MAGGKLNAGVVEQGGARYPGWMNNIGIVNATTTNANDSIKITGSDGTAFSSSNYGHITLPSATTGRLITLTMTADVTIRLDTAHWGFATKGNLTDYILYVYAINDAGTLRWGVGAKPNRLIVLNADDVYDSDPTNVNSYEKVMVDTVLGSDSDARVVGWFKANFNDTGDLWTVQSGDGDINIGSIGIEAIPMVAGYMQNIGFARVNVAAGDDSIRITSADGQALSTTNLGWIVLPGETTGQLQVFPVSADVTIALVGAHWGFGTTGDLTDFPLHLYAINDARILKWGVGAIQDLKMIDGADDSATATDINLIDEILVNSALSASAACMEVGWFKADFDDADGSSADIWSIGGGAPTLKDINIGKAPPLWKPHICTSSWTTNTTLTARMLKDGDTLHMRVKVALVGAPDATGLNITIMSGLTMDTAKLPSYGTADGQLGSAAILDAGTGIRVASAVYNSTTSVLFYSADASSDNQVTQLIPQTFASGDSVTCTYSFPITGWT